MTKPRNRKISQKEIARILGVSPATISNAFNQPHQLSANLREHILSECKRLGYHGPNAAASMLRKGKTGNICVVLSDSLSYSFSDPVANLFLEGVADILAKNSLNLLLIPGNDADSPQTNMEGFADGFIFYGAPRDPEIFNRIAALDKPIITVDFDHEPYGSVNVDNYEGAYQLTRSIIGQDTDIAVLGLRLIETDRVCRITPEELLSESESISRRRLQGYIQAARDLDREIPVDRIWTIPFNFPQYAEMAVKEVLAYHPRPKLLLCMSDLIALTAVRVALRAGLKIPEDIRIAGFDGITEAETYHPSVTTVYQHCLEKGHIAAQRLIDGNLQDKSTLETRVILRETT
ncbi:LacI family DNA-binding transcriptional regulator [Hahella ganghwensis]|uniref:LacI family DNA-binding transcriptional regulator n=1 Tax=Hahella ganghwensis TaxID=286420 RepID=UPI00036C5E45|nr:LacI family DNA-binding transcriptional regulator [Hahella ganghwensis]